MTSELEPGLYESLLTAALESRLADLSAAEVTPDIRVLANAEAADRTSRHIAAVVGRAIEAAPEQERAHVAVSITETLIEVLSSLSQSVDQERDIPLVPGRVLAAILRRKPDGSPDTLESPLTPLLDTTLLTNSPGEPTLGHELRAEIHSSDSVDVVVAFVRWSGIHPIRVRGIPMWSRR